MSDLAVVERNEISAAPITLMSLIEMAARRGASLDEMQQLFEFKLRIEADEARKAFIAAMTAFKANAIAVTKDKENKQYSSRYTSLGNLVQTVTPYLSENGLSVRWDIDQSAGIKVTCIITHAMGHSENVSLTCSPDKSDAKNPIQEIKSAITYAKGCTFESICGLASVDPIADDDGNSAGARRGSDMPEPDFVALMDSIQVARTLTELEQYFRMAYKCAKDLGDEASMNLFVKAKNKRKDQLV